MDTDPQGRWLRMKWTLQQAIELCRKVEAICPAFNCHVALTGGCLYKDGERKDCDLLFYSIRGKEIDKDGLRLALIEIGFDTFADYGFVNKSKYEGKSVGRIFPRGTGLRSKVVHADGT